MKRIAAVALLAVLACVLATPAYALLYRTKLPYDPFRDFIGVTALARQVGMLVTHPSLPARRGR